MRGAWLLLGLLVLPAALAQEPLPPLLETSIAPFPGPAVPLGAAVATTVTTRASCALAEPAGVSVSYAIPTQPTWATVVIEPATETAPLDRCDAGWVAFEATLVVTVSDQAPAFAPAAIEVAARVGSREARASVPIEATWFSVLDVQLAEAIAVVAPGRDVTFDLKLTNLGNAPVNVVAVLQKPAQTLHVTFAPSTPLGSKQAGDNDVSRTIEVRAHAEPEGGFVNRVETFALFLTAQLPSNGTEGDTSTASFVVTIRSASLQQGERLVPATPLLVLLAAGLAALGRR